MGTVWGTGQTIREYFSLRKVNDQLALENHELRTKLARFMEMAETELQNAHHEWFYNTILPLMEDNLVRVKEDLDWFVAKHDYRNASAPWKNAQDSVARTMQKLEGGYPADPVLRKDL